MSKTTPSQEAVRRDFRYEDGELIWVEPSSFHNRLRGKVAGRVSDGYRKIKFEGCIYSAHRLVWLYHYGDIPVEIDHINGDKIDNRVENLRAATRRENMRNLPLRCDNKSGVHGVMWEKGKGLWVARIPRNGKLTTLGRSKDINVVIALRRKAEQELGYHANHGRAA